MRWRTDAGLKERHNQWLNRIRRSTIYCKGRLCIENASDSIILDDAGKADGITEVRRDQCQCHTPRYRNLTKPIKVNEFMETLDMALEFAKTQPAGAKSEEKV